MAPSVPPRCWGMTEGFTLAFILILAATIGPVHAENSFDEHQNELCNIVDELQFSGTKANQTVQWQVDIALARQVLRHQHSCVLTLQPKQNDSATLFLNPTIRAMVLNSRIFLLAGFHRLKMPTIGPICPL